MVDKDKELAEKIVKRLSNLVTMYNLPQKVKVVTEVIKEHNKK